MIGEVFFGIILIFFVLGFLHSQEEVEVENRRLPAAPVFYPLIILFPFAVTLALFAPAIGALIATIFEKTAVALHVKATNDSLTITYTNRPPSGGITFNYDWLSVVYILAAGIGPLAAYYAGYNLGNWLLRKELVPLLIRYPLFVVEEPEIVRVEVAPPRKKRREKEEEENVILKGDLF